jgi:hypothetical protein
MAPAIPARRRTPMPGGMLQLLLHKNTGRTPKPTRVARSIPRIGRAALIERRDGCMAEIGRLRVNGDASSDLATKALQLLTAHWATSSWRARQDILRTAEWLLGISRKAADPSAIPSDDTVRRSRESDSPRAVSRKIAPPLP